MRQRKFHAALNEEAGPEAPHLSRGRRLGTSLRSADSGDSASGAWTRIANDSPCGARGRGARQIHLPPKRLNPQCQSGARRSSRRPRRLRALRPSLRRGRASLVKNSSFLFFRLDDG